MARRISLLLLIACSMALVPVSPGYAAGCDFVLGFKALHDLIPTTVGECLEFEYFNPENGDSLQQTTGGLLVWRKADNWTAFTDGYHSWINGPYGLQERLNTERFAWEAASAPKPQPTPTPISPAPAARPLTIADLDGTATIVAQDGHYLGLISSNNFDSDSICNPFGDYGSKYSDTSIRNPYSDYGSPYASSSAYNPYSDHPPLIVYHEYVVGHLTKNHFASGALDPDLLIAILGCTKQ